MPSKMASSIITAVNTTTLAFQSGKSASSPPPPKKMSITQTYYLAHTARSKLAKEAARADHDLRLLVGHANMLDSLMLDLANAEREQEQWFNNTVRNATKKSAAQPSHIRWADSIEEESMEDDSSDDSDDSDFSDSDDDDYSDYDEEEEEEKMKTLTALYIASAKPLRRAPSPPALVTIDVVSLDEEDEEDEEDENEDKGHEQDEDEEADAARLTLTRSPSRQYSPPELLDDLSSDEDDEISMPPSPEDVPLDTFSSTTTTTKRTNMLTDTTSQSLFEEHDYILNQGTMIPAY